METSYFEHPGSDVCQCNEAIGTQCVATLSGGTTCTVFLPRTGEMGAREVLSSQDIDFLSDSFGVVSTASSSSDTPRAQFTNRLRRATFSGAFETGALHIVPKSSIIFNIFINIALYVIFTMCCFWAANPPERFARPLNRHIADSRPVSRLPNIFKRVLTVKSIPMAETVAVCFCGAAKTQSVGIPLVDAMWKQHDNLTRSLVQIPVLLYTMEQVFVAQLLVYAFKRWMQNGQKRARDVESTASEADALHSRGNVETASRGNETSKRATPDGKETP